MAEPITIDSLCESGVVELQTGPFGSQLHAHEYVESGVPVVPTEAIRNRQIDHEKLPKISEEKANDLSRHRLKPGDILFARRGVQATGQSALVRQEEANFICGTGAIRLRVTPQNACLLSNFLSHVLMDRNSREWIRHNAIGATMPNLNEGIIRRFTFIMPSIDEQLAIALLLDAFDDKIELNRRMNETLEAMARAIFKDWFVDFGPTRAKMEGREPYLAADIWSLFPDRLDEEGTPEGWRAKPLDQIADFLNGLALQKYPAVGEAYLPIIKIAQLRAGHTRGADKASILVPPAYVVENGDVLFSWSGSLLHQFWTGGLGALNQHLFKVTSAEYPKWFYFHWIAHHMPSFQATAAGKATTMGHIQRHHLNDAITIVPNQDVMRAGDECIGRLCELLIANTLQSETLATTRDLLLPKLMSGEIRLRDAERLAEAAE